MPQGSYLLDDVKIKVEGESQMKASALQNYLRQQPNHTVMGGLKLQLAFYSLSGRDSSNWFNKWVRRVGQPPVIYSRALTDQSVTQLTKAMQNKGYLDARVWVDSMPRPDKKRMKLIYNVVPGEPHVISSVGYNIPNDTLREIILSDSSEFLVRPGNLFDRNVLDQERDRITMKLRNRGYYAFNKDYITYNADTAAGSKDVNLVLNTLRPQNVKNMPFYTSHKPFYVRNVVFVTNYDPLEMQPGDNFSAKDTVMQKGLTIFYDDDHYIRPGVIEESCFITPGMQYCADDIRKTYQAFGRLGIVKFININFRLAGEIDGRIWLDAYVLLTKGKSQTVSLSLEGTNSEGDLGFGVEASYSHRNIGHGSEILTTKFRASYESLSGDLSGLINKNYTEYAADVSLTFPKFKAPFLKKEFKQKILATTEFATTFSYQERPEYTRIIAGAGWKYHWSQDDSRTRHTYDFIDVNYVYLPKSRANFLDSISNPVLRYSYENHFIMRMGYIFYHTNKDNSSLFSRKFQENIYTFRVSVETAGNLLYAASKIAGSKKTDGSYRVFGIGYSQYVKGDMDYTLTHKFSTRHMLAFHAGFGIGIPYGNSTILPFEKRFYGGGANGVRGWSVRTLGPGRYAGNNNVNNFINQCGDIRLDLSLEYRAKLFWVLEMAAFIDGGNIWTIREYENQPGGLFKFNSFYKEIALAYGLGLRLDFNYFLLRFDLGMKAYNPAEGEVKWAIAHHNWSRDAAFHFSVGYPF